MRMNRSFRLGRVLALSLTALVLTLMPGQSANAASYLASEAPRGVAELDSGDEHDTDPEREVRRLVEEGRKRLEERDFEAAAEALSRAVVLDPADFEARTAYATALRRLGRLEEANRLLAETIERFPQAQEPLVAMGYHNRAMGHLDESVRWFTRAANMEDGWYNYIRLAVSYTDLGDLDQMTRATNGLATSPYGQVLGRTLDQLYRGQFAAALSHAEAGLEQGEDELWRSLAADLAILVRDYDRALQHYKVLAPELLSSDPVVNPANATEALWLANVFNHTGHPDKATQLARRILAVLATPDEGYELPLRKVYRMAAQVLLEENEAALAEFRDAIDQGYRSVLFERMVRFEDFELFSPLHENPRFLQMLTEIKTDNARMLAVLGYQTDGSVGRA